MRADNGWYGHRRAMAWYAGITSPRRPIAGTLVHGWTYDHMRLNGLKYVPLPIFVWNERHHRQAQSNGERSHLIGAPFAYWLSAIDLLNQPSPRGSGTLFVPNQLADDHYWDSFVNFVLRQSKQYPTPFYVSVLPRDFNKKFHLQRLSQNGVKPVSKGLNNGPVFLDRLVSHLLQVEYVVSDDPRTQIFYAGLLSRRVSVLPNFEQQLSKDITHVGDSSLTIRDVDRSSSEPLKDRFPELPSELFSRALTKSESRELAEYELGMSHMQSPAVLRRTLGFEGPSSISAQFMRIAFSLHGLITTSSLLPMNRRRRQTRSGEARDSDSFLSLDEVLGIK